MRDKHVDDVSLRTYIHRIMIESYIHHTHIIYIGSEFAIIMLLLYSGLAQARPELVTSGMRIGYGYGKLHVFLL